MKTLTTLAVFVLLLAFTACDKSETNTTEADLQTTQQKFTKVITIYDANQVNSVQMEIETFDKATLNEYNENDYVLIPQNELEIAQLGSADEGTSSIANREINEADWDNYNGIIPEKKANFKLLEQSLTNDVKGFVVVPANMVDVYDNYAPKTELKSLNITMTSDYIINWCTMGEFMSYFYVDGQYKFGFLLREGEYAYNIDYTAPYNHKIYIYPSKESELVIFSNGNYYEYNTK